MAQRQIIVYRTRPKETRIQNSIIWDDALSISARFALIAMLSLPDSWDYSVRGMAVMLHVSKDTMSKYLRELEDAGYLRRQQTSGEDGKFAGSQYIITDTPGNFGAGAGLDQPCPKNSDTESPCPKISAPVFSAPENSPQKIHTEQKKRTEQNTPQSPQGGRRRKKSELTDDVKAMLRGYVGADQELAQNLAALMEVRIEKKAVNSPRAIKMLLSELDRLSAGRRDQKLMLIQKAVTNSWKSVYPIQGLPNDRAAPESEVRYGVR